MFLKGVGSGLFGSWIIEVESRNNEWHKGGLMDEQKIHVSPKKMEDVYENIHFDEALSVADPRYVETARGRGDDYLKDLAGFFNVNMDAAAFRGNPPKHVSAVLCGHRGCGKSTELNRFAERLNKEKLFFVVKIDAFQELNSDDIQFVDVFMALAKKLFAALEEIGVAIPEIYLENLEKWFFQRIVFQDNKQEWALDIKSGIEGKVQIPLFLKLFANLTSAFRNSSTYVDQLRRQIQNSFGEFAVAFNQLIAYVVDQLPKKANRRSLLFVVDGLDKLSNDNFNAIFVEKVGQLRQIKSNVLYAAPIDFLYSGNQIQQDFEAAVLPMIKLFEKNGEIFQPGREVLKEMIYKRADASLFEPNVADDLVAFSGGNPRHLVQLLKYMYVRGTDRFTNENFKYAGKRFATNYERFLTDDDYDVLQKQDQNPEDTTSSEQKRRLLHDLALLQYNSFWWRSHPAVQTLPAYKKRMAKHDVSEIPESH